MQRDIFEDLFVLGGCKQSLGKLERGLDHLRFLEDCSIQWGSRGDKAAISRRRLLCPQGFPRARRHPLYKEDHRHQGIQAGLRCNGGCHSKKWLHPNGNTF